MDKPNDIELEKNEKWDFEDYAFTIATVLFFAFMVFGIFIASFTERFMGIHRWWPFSWMFFMFAWSACLIKDVVDIKRGIKDADLENDAETALYVGITTIMLIFGIIRGDFYSSWLAGPIVFVLFTFIWPRLRSREDKGQEYVSKIPMILLIAGIIAEVVIGGWIALPISWILISAYKVYGTLRNRRLTEDLIVDVAYNVFTIIFLTVSLVWGSWIISWLSYPLSVIIGKVVSKTKKLASKGS